LKVIFLGTGTSQGVPVIGCDCDVCQSLDYRDTRLRTSVYVEVNGIKLVIDTGPDFRQQMLRENIRHIDGILYTHAHRDHMAGLDDIRSYNFLQETTMPAYGTEATLNQLAQDFSYIFGPKNYPGLPRVTLTTIGYEPFAIQGIIITPLPVLHFKMPVTGFRIGNFSYITDANMIPETTLERLEGTDVLVLNALQRERHISHFNLEEALAMVEVIRPKKTYFTHISHKLGLHATVSAELPDTVRLAYDGLQLNIQD
jgi:phosphoribosyl 1,2-cyclic phosphate phosphodiesterase